MLSEWEKSRKMIAEEMVNMPSVTVSLTAGDILGIVTLCQCASRNAKASAIILEMAQAAVVKIQNFLAGSRVVAFSAFRNPMAERGGNCR